MELSPDSLAMILLCSQLGLTSEADPAALTLRHWNPLARQLQAIGMSPADLLGCTVEDLQSRLGLSVEESTRLVSLLARAPELEKELDHYASMGILPLTRIDPDYPQRFRARLKDSAPVVLFYAGEKALLGQPGIAVVGSRRLDEAGQECAIYVGHACGHSGLVLYSGGAKGVDTISMTAALEQRGCGVGILADSLEKALRPAMIREHLENGNLCLVTPYAPNASFTIGGAMGRNRLIYTLADYAIVVASEPHKGGTWAGASEALKNGWLPVFVLEHTQMPEGNRLLLQKGALPLPYPFTEPPSRLRDWLEANAPKFSPPAAQLGLF